MGIGVAVSGGGHRATVWGWGALLALTDCGLNRDVVSIASVSGGSIASGVVANGGDFAAMSADELERVIAPGLRVVAHDGLFFFGPATNRYLAAFFSLAGLSAAALVALLVAVAGTARAWPLPPFALAGVPLAALAWVLALRKGKLPAAIAGLVVGALLLAGPLAVAFLAVTGAARGWDALWRAGLPVAVTAAVLLATLAVFGRRSEVVDGALARTLLHRAGRPTRLAEVDSSVHHVFCSTELQSGDQVYLTPRLVYGYRVGRGTPADLPLSTAVQCSACLPGAFVARELPTDAFRLSRPWRVTDDEPPAPPDLLVVNDGGVYDNMADQWEQGFRDRGRRIPDLATVQPPADTLVVVNAGKALGWNPLRRARGISAEIRGLSRTVDILYDVSTSHRRQGLVTRFGSGRDLTGCLVHIAQSPFDIPKAFARSRDHTVAARAAEALTLLDAVGASEVAWETRAAGSPRVPTVLSALGVRTTADLLEHAFLLTVVNCYVILGLGVLPSKERFARSRFEQLAEGRA